MRMWACLAVIAVLSFFVLGQAVMAPELRPSWYEIIVTLTGVAMCWGGVEACRWLLRDSALTGINGPRSDWDKLWLYTGVPSGLLMIFWSVLAWALHSFVSHQVMILLLSQALLGPVLWMACLPWVATSVLSVGRNHLNLLAFAGLGVFFHLLGTLFCLYIFPNFAAMNTRSIFAMVSALGGYYPLAFFHLLLIGCMWSLALKVMTVSKPDNGEK